MWPDKSQAHFVKQLQKGSGDDQHVKYQQIASVSYLSFSFSASATYSIFSPSSFSATASSRSSYLPSSSQASPWSFPVSDDEDEEEERSLHGWELGSCWWESKLAQGDFGAFVLDGDAGDGDGDGGEGDAGDAGDAGDGRVVIIIEFVFVMAMAMVMAIVLEKMHI